MPKKLSDWDKAQIRAAKQHEREISMVIPKVSEIDKGKLRDVKEAKREEAKSAKRDQKQREREEAKGRGVRMQRPANR